MDEEKKVCTRCDTKKTMGQFHRWSLSPDGRKGYCITCASAINRRYRAENRAAVLQRSKEKHYREEYGVTLAEKEIMFDQQGKICAGCGSSTPRHNHGWSLDHDHTNGKLRGVLCSPCNTALGMVRDNVETLQKLVVYLQFHRMPTIQDVTV